MNRFMRVMSPRSGGVFQILVATRISGAPNQKAQSNEDQRDNCIEFLGSLLERGTPTEVRTVACVAKGELLEREEIVTVERELRTKLYDVFIVEDVGRLARDVVAKFLFGIAADHGTRGLAINDDVDTWDSGWEEKCLEACANHVGHNHHLSNRIKQKMRNRFRTRGELFQNPIAGYRRYKHDGLCDMARDEKWEPIIRQAAAMLILKLEKEST